MKERRAIRRWQINWPAKIKLEGALAFITCSVGDLSLKGFKAALAPKLPTDTFLKLDVILEEGCVLEDVEVWVAWQKRMANLNLYGFYFSRLKDADKEKIYRFMRRHYPKILHHQCWQGITKAGQETQDNRIFERFKAQLPLKFLDLNTNKEGQAFTEDISAKGMGLAAEKELKPGAALEMWLQVSDKGDPLYMRGEVVWSRPQGLSQYRTGVKLEKANLMELSRILRAV